MKTSMSTTPHFVSTATTELASQFDTNLGCWGFWGDTTEQLFQAFCNPPEWEKDAKLYVLGKQFLSRLF